MTPRRINYNIVDDFLKAHPEMKWEDFQKQCPEKCSVWSFYNRRKILGLTKTISTKSSQKPDQVSIAKTFKSGSKISQLFQLLQQNPNGIKGPEAAKILKVAAKTLSNLIYRLKHEFKCNITRKNGFHKLKGSTILNVTPDFMPDISNNEQTPGIISDFKSMGFDFKLVLAELEGLTPEKKLNYIDQLERSIFFRLSSQAIKSADRISKQLTTIISS